VLSRDSGAPEVDVFRLMFAIVAAMAVLGFVSTLFIERHPARRIEDPLDGVGIAPGVAG
jgi:hypothetical protein